MTTETNQSSKRMSVRDIIAQNKPKVIEQPYISVPYMGPITKRHYLTKEEQEKEEHYRKLDEEHEQFNRNKIEHDKLIKSGIRIKISGVGMHNKESAKKLGARWAPSDGWYIIENVNKNAYEKFMSEF